MDDRNVFALAVSMTFIGFAIGALLGLTLAATTEPAPNERLTDIRPSETGEGYFVQFDGGPYYQWPADGNANTKADQ